MSDVSVKVSELHGSGVFAERAFARGEAVHTMGGRELSWAQCTAEIALRRVRLDDPLQIDDSRYLVLDETSLRFNHSCDPNAAIRGSREVFALRPIAAGEEITFDYALTVRPRFYTRFWRMPCACGAKSCRGVIGDIMSVPSGRRQAMVDSGALQDYMVRWLYQSPWNWNTYGPAPAPPLPGKDHSIFIPGGRTGLLLIHGLGGTPLEMRATGEAMARQGYSVCIPQLAGHCGTYEDLKKPRWHDWVASVFEGLQRLRQTCDTVVVGGLSTGAILSLNLAARYPDMVQGVAVLAPTIWLNGWMVPYHAYLFNIVLQKPVANFFDFPDLPPHGIKDPAIRQRIKSAIQSGDSSIAGVPVTPGGAVLEARWLTNATRRDMKWIKQPVLIVHPREDDYADLNNIAYLMRNLAGPVETITLEDSYHIVTVDRQAHILEERLAAFLARVSAHAKTADAAAPPSGRVVGSDTVASLARRAGG